MSLWLCRSYIFDTNYSQRLLKKHFNIATVIKSEAANSAFQKERGENTERERESISPSRLNLQDHFHGENQV